MKRFKIEFQVNGKTTELYAEPMDEHHRMYSLERQLMDPHPLLIERSDDGWRVTSQDSWNLSSQEVDALGDLLDKEYPKRPQE